MKPIEWLRIITPVLISLVLGGVVDLRMRVGKLEDTVEEHYISVTNRLTKIETLLRMRSERDSGENLSSLPKVESSVREMGRIQRLN